MTTPNTAPGRFVGCDVGKNAITVFDSHDARTRTIPNRPADLDRFARRLDPDCLVVCETTGGYEAALLAALVEAGIPAHRAHARKVKAFIRSYGTLAKTDAIDARALARYAQERHPYLPRWTPPDRDLRELQSLVRTRQTLVADRKAYGNRLQAPGAEHIEPVLRPLIDRLDQAIRAIQHRITDCLRSSDRLREAADVVRSVTGFADVNTPAILACMPELGTLNRHEAAALANCAPHPRQSGQSDAYRHTRGGRPEVKPILFSAALVAAKHDPVFSAFYQRLRQNGKKPLVALTALMRKLIVILNAKLKGLYSSLQVS